MVVIWFPVYIFMHLWPYNQYMESMIHVVPPCVRIFSLKRDGMFWKVFFCDERGVGVLRYALLCVMACGLIASRAHAATITGYVLDPNWWAPHPKLSGVYGVGQYEYGISGNPSGSSALGLVANTENNNDNFYQGIFGYWRAPSVPDGNYTIATWDTWWRSSFLFNQQISGSVADPIFLRLNATMWSYGAQWYGNHNEFGQTFAATGSSIVMLTVRSANGGFPITASFHERGPGGSQVGPSKTISFGASDNRIFWNGGEVPTVPGNIYYLSLKAPAGNFSPVLTVNDPVPDLSAASPEGRAWFDGVPASDSRLDLGIVIMSDDDGIITNMNVRPGGASLSNSTSVGQTFFARGTSLISFSAWIPAGDAVLVATLYDGVNGSRIGTAKRSKLMRWGDPVVMFNWAPGEAPLTPGMPYYLEVTRDDGGTISSAYVNQYAQYPGGNAFRNRAVQPANVDLAGTIMEEESPGSAAQTRIVVTEDPKVNFSDRGPSSVTIRFKTNIPVIPQVQYAPWRPPYTQTAMGNTKTTNHAVTIGGLLPNTMYHMRIRMNETGYRSGLSRDFVVATTSGQNPNLLVNPSFEDGSGTSPRKPVPGWNTQGMDFGASDGSWFWSLPPYSGNWFLQGAVNGHDIDAVVYQRVTNVTPGRFYNFTAAVSSWMRENDTWKYDVWNQGARMAAIQVGIDPAGGTDPNSPTVQWNPWMISHLRYNVVGLQAVSTGNSMTVYFRMKGRGGQWHLFGIDDCRLTELEQPDSTPPTAPVVTDEGAYTLSTSQLTASWTATDPQSGIAEYQYTIGTAPGQTDVAAWTSAGLNTSVTRTGLALSPGLFYYFTVKARNGANLWSAEGYSDGITVAMSGLTLGQAKAYPDGHAFSFTGKQVTARSGGNFWIQELDGSAGIRVASGTAISPRALLNLNGVLKTVDGERRLNPVQLVNALAGPVLKPVFVSNQALGGQPLGLHAPGVTGGVGTNNIGLLVKLWGTVTAIGTGYYYIDDGAGLLDGSQTAGVPNVGVRVVGSPGAATVGRFVTVQGLSSTFKNSGGEIHRCLIAPATPVLQ